MRELTEDEVLEVILAHPTLEGRIKLTYESGPYDVTSPTNVAMVFAKAIQRKVSEINDSGKAGD